MTNERINRPSQDLLDMTYARQRQEGCLDFARSVGERLRRERARFVLGPQP
jgi:hypothetical protein